MYYIYKITNLINNKMYIGLTNNISRRRARHFTDLKCNRHDNSFLQKEYNIYGKENFSFNIEFEGNVSYEEISEKEKYYIKKYDSYKNGYNQNEGGNFGPSNGGTHLTQSDIFNILAACEFMSRPGQILADMYDVSKTTISRIKKGINHNQYKEEYDNLSFKERKDIYQTFCDSTNFIKDKVNTTIIQSKRKLNQEQVFMILYNFEKRIIPISDLMAKVEVNSSNTLYCINRGDTYKDYAFQYKQMTDDEKKYLASLLRN